jgi:hypothetical protein
VEMRRGVITIIHFDRNAEETTDDGHAKRVPSVIAISTTDPLRASSIHCTLMPAIARDRTPL